MRRSIIKKASVVVAGAVLVSMMSAITPAVRVSAADDGTYKAKFMELYNKIHDAKNGYFSPQGIPYHSIETLMCEAPDYGHETTSETFSYYLWLEAMADSFTGDWSSFNTAWDTLEKYIIPNDQDQLETSMSRYNAAKPATYAPEGDLPSDYPSPLDSSAPVGTDPIHNELQSTYGTSLMYGMHWLLDTDNWYGYGRRGDGKSTPSYINTYQRGPEESCWETITQPCWDDFSFGGKNGYLDLFTGDSSYAKQFKYTIASDADARAIQATYDAMLWSDDNGASIANNIGRASKLGDYLRYSMFDKYFRKIGKPSEAGTGYDACHYLLSWYYAWGGALDGGWSWKIGCSHVHFGYQNPLAAWVLSNTSEFKPKSPNGANDWKTSLQRQIELYQWLQSAEGAIAGGCSNSNAGRYLAWPSDTKTFYGMGYQEHPVYHDPGSNRWFGFQAWSMQRVAEYYYTTKDPQVKDLLDKWISWVKSVIIFNDDGTFLIPSNLIWEGEPETWTGTPKENKNLHVSVESYGTDVGIAGSLANALIYYAVATGDTESKNIAQQLIDRIFANYSDEKGVSAPEVREDYTRFNQPIYVPAGWTGTMPNGDPINSNSTFLSIRSKYLDEPDWAKVQNYLDGGEAPVFNYHRFWAQTEVAVATGLFAKFFEEDQGDTQNSNITPTAATFDKNVDNQADINVTMTLNGNTLVGITDGTNELVEGRDYTVNGNTVVISKDYLAQQDEGTLRLQFIFSAGARRTLTVTIIDSSTENPPPVTGNLEVQMFNSNTQTTTNGIMPHFRLVNTGTEPINLSDVKLHYYYTADGSQQQNFWCDWSNVGSNNVIGTFKTLSTPKTGADTCLEITFSSGAGTLAPGQSIEVQARFSKTDWSNYNQADDYSFNSSGSSYASWTKVTAYLGDELIWGVEP
ncbi:glycoside hydrolase family 48 protein [[Clostridium] cellulosi]